MRLLTPRLEIRLATAGEGNRLAHYYASNREYLQPFYPRFSAEDFDTRSWESTLPNVRAEYESRRSIRLCLFMGRDVKGVVNITNATQSPKYAATLGYSLSQDCQGKGLMREALEKILPFAFSHLRLHRIEANYMPRNERSGRTLAAVGFQKEGLALQYLMINGVWEDHVLTAKINPDWK